MCVCMCVCVCVCVFMRVYLCRGSIIFRSESTTLQPSISHYTLCTKNHIFRFLNILKRWSSSKKLRSNMVFFYYQQRWFFSPKLRSYSLDGKWRMVFPKKQKQKQKNMKIWFFQHVPKCSGKMVFPKKLHWSIIFLVLSGKMIFRSTENMILFFRRKMKDHISQKSTWKNYSLKNPVP